MLSYSTGFVKRSRTARPFVFPPVSGFKRALGTIIDSHITTIIAGIVLYQLGTGSVKGFAMTLMIGILDEPVYQQ